MDDFNENNELDKTSDVSDIDNEANLTDEEIKRRQDRKEKLLKEKREKEEEAAKNKRKTITSLIIFGIILFIIGLGYFALKNLMPGHYMKQGKKYLEIQQYDNALKMFKLAANARPYDEEPLYYEVVTLSKMPVTYDTQKALYDISQYEDCDKASEYADEILSKMKRQIEASIGSNYADNILYDDIVFRWNNKQPIKYTISNQSNVSSDYGNEVRKAFAGWSRLSNGEIMFTETPIADEADIVVNLVKFLYETEQFNNKDISGEMIPVIEKDKLNKVNVNIKTDYNNTPANLEKFATVAKHEIGHALGIGGHSSDPNDIMYNTGDYLAESTPNKDFTTRDANTLTLLYKLVPDVINQPIDKKDYNNLFYHYAITTIPGTEFDKEISRLIAELQYNGQDIVKWVDLAINYGYKKQYKRSNSILRRIVPLAKNDSHNTFVILYNMAVNSYKMRNYEDSERYLKIAQEFDSTDLDAIILETFNDLKLNRKETAKTKLIMLNNKYPKHIEIALKLANVYNSDKQTSKAKEVIEKLIKNNPEALNDRRVDKYRVYIIKKEKDEIK